MAILLRPPSAEGSGLDLSSCKAVILEVNIAGGLDVLVEEVFLEKANVLLLFSPHFLPNLPFQNKLLLSF